jgi:uncharacterized protein (TIGR03086 family)
MTETYAGPRPDLGPLAAQVADVVRGITDDQLDGPTPCPEMSVATLLDHLAGLSLAFTAAARHEQVPGGDQPPTSDGSRLDPDFRTTIPAALEELAAAWREPAAWTGMAQAGGVDMPGEVAGLVALDEVLVHGWDLAVATGQPYDPPADAIEGALGFVGPTAEASPEGTPGLFGPVVEVAPSAPALHRLLGATGRDPSWSPPA